MANVRCVLPALFAALLLVAAARAQDAAASSSERAKANTTRETMRALTQDLRAHVQSRGGDYPKELKELVPNIREAIPRDGWGRDFTYEKLDANGESDYRLASLGSDGKKGGTGTAADIVFTKAGETRELSAEEKAAREKRLQEATFQGHVAVARLEMAVIGSLVVDHRQDKKAWPQSLAEVRPKGDNGDAKAKARCFTDPWGKEYELRLLPKDNLAIVCWGADGKAGGQENAADFVITEKEIRNASGGGRYSRWGGWGGGEWQLYNLTDSVRTYQRQRGALPKSLDDLVKPGDKAGQNAVRASIPRDRWGNEYVYVVYGDDEFFLIALGKDGIQGGKGDDADAITPQPGVFETNEEFAEPPKAAEEDKDALKAEVALEQLKDIAEKLNEHKKEKGSYPESLDTIKDKFPEQTVPADPWGNAYVLTLTKDDKGAVTGFTVKSGGRDGADGGEGNDADIVVNDKGEQLGKPARATPEEDPTESGE